MAQPVEQPVKSKTLVVRSAVIAALGGLLFGFDTAVISGAERSIQELFQLDGFWHGFTVAIALIGTVVGSLTGGKPADKYGRNSVLMAIAVLYLVSALGSALTSSWIGFLIFRFIGGLGVGASSVIGPMYIAEISPAALRGRLVGLFQFNIVLGILLAFLSNYMVASMVTTDAWRWMLGIESAPALLFLVLIFLLPSSPRWLVLKNRREEAADTLARLGVADVGAQLKVIEESVYSEQHLQTERLFVKRLRVPVMLAILIAFFNQFSGINAIMYYAPRIFEIAGLDHASALFQSVAIGVTNLVFTMLAMSIIDKVGRKTLLLIGSAGTVVSLGLVSTAFFGDEPAGGAVVLVGLLGFIAFFAASQGAVIWVYISEIFPNRTRAKGQTLGSSTHWILAAIISWLFPVVVGGDRMATSYAFAFFTLMMLLQGWVVWRYFPETKGKSLEQIQEEFGL
ncbi:sugar porter family MFS transporter [Pontibacter sp. SGAir0037]|uniref:sugar porter family MFS transporter n=1 Tax=Pontibacter sp. SGAir0037 TaxID=2571030 RepID=UPI0010CCC040|nr:sugar porter family MFS transporter [Pontibacter sp. SGAir0037]QCR23188.1 MFS transporter [Pontibacter sp. SGAir0037]